MTSNNKIYFGIDCGKTIYEKSFKNSMTEGFVLYVTVSENEVVAVFNISLN